MSRSCKTHTLRKHPDGATRAMRSLHTVSNTEIESKVKLAGSHRGSRYSPRNVRCGAAGFGGTQVWWGLLVVASVDRHFYSTFLTNNLWAYLGPARLGETRQAAVRALLCGSCSARLPPRCGGGGSTTREIVAGANLPGKRAERGSFLTSEALHVQRDDCNRCI